MGKRAILDPTNDLQTLFAGHENVGYYKVRHQLCFTGQQIIYPLSTLSRMAKLAQLKRNRASDAIVIFDENYADKGASLKSVCLMEKMDDIG